MDFDPNYVEQDRDVPTSSGDLPTYDDLAVQHGPNSRFGRWREWIEKRAAERYRDITPEERQRRRGRGWGNDDDLLQSIIPSLPFVCQKLKPTRAKMFNFGSRFLPHCTSPIRCLLPILNDRMLLIGHDNGLSVLDMYPRIWDEHGGTTVRGPEEAEARLIWRGESVLQMSLLETETTPEGNLCGVVLALTGPEGGLASDEGPPVLRMYNLASLVNLAQWAVRNKDIGGPPLDLYKTWHLNAQATPTKKHRPQHSFARSLRSFIDQPLGAGCVNSDSEPQTSSYHSMLSPSRIPNPRTLSPQLWAVVEDEAPVRWATDFVPLAAPGSRLAQASIQSYAIWKQDDKRADRGQLLAVATKTNVLLYETPRGERAFRFVKEFYTPMPAKSITFFQQNVSEVVRSLSENTFRLHRGHARTTSTQSMRPMEGELTRVSINYGTQLCLFVVFGKKAGWIRLADSAVGEFTLHDEEYASMQQQHAMSASASSSPVRLYPDGGTTPRRSRASFEMQGPRWIAPATCELPLGNTGSKGKGIGLATRKVYVLTRGRRTHILPRPLPSNSAMSPPLYAVAWRSAPTTVTARCDVRAEEPFLQLVALGEEGAAVQEVPLAFLAKGSRGRVPVGVQRELRVAEEELGAGDAAFLCEGGHWDTPSSSVQRSSSTRSGVSEESFDSVDTEDLVTRMQEEQGMYAWYRKDAEDWRVFWLGGPLSETAGDGDDDDDDNESRD
ncbi:hypothetical protein FISHEDRAFT_68270 [Fistulina hepatica ATCC 64428]|uniref:Uncharacterized protein n=1 Tax=Fistulina hepatica ATCC 64428 TaxID=1128425 RepID=A0A0D6ZZB4_9AGAR|nr:hypothetical protein FISHEDRAFT_68270 [Fistulina hepatica ATCC 64428]